MSECFICCEKTADTTLVCCQNKCCGFCLKTWLMSSDKCPQCSHTLTFHELKHIFSDKVFREIIGQKLFKEQLKYDYHQNMPNMSSITFCPKKDCRGFIGTDSKCSKCQLLFCYFCHKIIDDSKTHSCKKEDIESVENIEKTSKRCPSCKSSIFKDGGCSSMTCKICGTVFNWETMKLENKPHETDRQTTPSGLHGIYQQIKSESSRQEKAEFINMVIVIFNIPSIINKYPVYTMINSNNDLRLKFHENKLSEKQMINRLLSRFEKTSIHLQIRSPLVHLYETGLYLLDTLSSNGFKNTLREMTYLFNDVTDQLTNICQAHKIEFPFIKLKNPLMLLDNLENA